MDGLYTSMASLGTKNNAVTGPCVWKGLCSIWCAAEGVWPACLCADALDQAKDSPMMMHARRSP